MGNACNCVRNQTQEEDDEALLRGLMEENERLRGPPPPYQVGVTGKRPLLNVPCERADNVFGVTSCSLYSASFAYNIYRMAALPQKRRLGVE